jgi:hypothetical protein
MAATATSNIILPEEHHYYCHCLENLKSHIIIMIGEKYKL